MKNNNKDQYIAIQTLIEDKKVNILSDKMSLQFKQWFFILLKLVLETIFFIWFIFTIVFIFIQVSPNFDSTSEYGASKYFDYLGNFLSFDWGYSVAKGADFSSFASTNIEYSFLIIFIVLFFSSIVAVFSSYFLSIKKFKGEKFLSKFIAIFSYAFSPFVFGIMFFMFASNKTFLENQNNFLPIFLVIFSLFISISFFYTHLISKSLKKEKEKTYFNFLYTKGLNEKNILKNHLSFQIFYYYIYYLPVVMVLLIFNSIALEILFNIPGISSLLVISIKEPGGDGVLFLDSIMIYSILFVVIFGVREILTKIADPKIRHLK
ncbi:MAG: hypothetical protein HPAVJP_5420 [Candidatus Hepatoplasma vulgare]|nr:MAG: hypothetical protein HPAVJP_5420 [Candidatus Hepatoplasma sp.]